MIIGLNQSAIGTLVERTTRFTMLLHLPGLDGYGKEPRVHNGPALAGHGAEAVRDAIASSIHTLPEQLRCSLTWDQGAEMARHDQVRLETGLKIYFCDPHSPWQRGTNENTNGLLKTVFSKGHRPRPLYNRRAQRRCCYIERTAEKIAWMENPSRGTAESFTIAQRQQCCDDHLSLGWLPRSE